MEKFTMGLDDKIYQCITARGYHRRDDGTHYEVSEFVARQIIKALEEACEAAYLIEFDDPCVKAALIDNLGRTMMTARQIFDMQAKMKVAIDKSLLEELADICVPPLAAFGMLKVGGERIILNKASADVARGVRK